MAAEMCLLQLPSLLADPNNEFTPSSFFSEQLTAFELWLTHGHKDKRPPEQLPIVLQVSIGEVHADQSCSIAACLFQATMDNEFGPPGRVLLFQEHLVIMFLQRFT